MTSVAPSGSGMLVMSMITPSRRSMRAAIGSRSSIAVTAARKLRHTALSSCSAWHQAVTCFDVRMLVERLGRELPHALEGRIVQPHAAVAAEHRHRLGQMVERLALHLDQRVVAAMHARGAR